jgi:hypothetical protein
MTDDLAEIKARMAASAARQTERFAQRMAVARAVPVAPLAIPGTRDFALGAIGPGWKVFSAERHLAAGEDDMAFAQPVGGTVVEVIHDRLVDRETGEIAERTRYRCLATWHPSKPWHLLDAGEVDVDQLAGVDRQSATTAVRWLLRPVARSEGRLLTGKELAAVVDAYRLALAVSA